MSVHITEANYLLLEVSSTTLSPSILHRKSDHITEAKYLLLEVNTTTSSPSFWHMKSDHITEAKVLLLEISTTTLSPSIWHLKSVYITEAKFSDGGQYYYLESQWLTHWCQYTSLRSSIYCKRSVLLHWVPVSDTCSQYTSLRPRFYC